MSQNTITFEMGGRIDIKQFNQGISACTRLILALTGKEKVDWVVEDLQPGSATTTWRGEGAAPAVIEGIVRQYEKISKGLANEEDIPVDTKRQRKAVDAVVKVAGSVEYVRLETPESSVIFCGNGAVPTKPATTIAVGAVTGKVQVLSSRGRLRFNLYDTVHDQAVSCYLRPGQEELMREAWGQRAIVSGQVTRDAATGRPIALRQISGVEILEDAAPGAYRAARGVVPWKPGDRLPEEVIRELRDA